ncbi:papain-like cysteine protease family protein [Lentilactobacillus sp. SPB1-3]|uniref:Uncharacterized protein n=1 Tax=Lentilactobacillus terminaliae TaxID=3003483 RepID=A0ACD5DCH6_9LACO|nr:papain-like cysteine protease family protein [Lentilactobacillus sp. SPB1-3]MCZ0977439.1 hypothetical protein [Lentilactobacillus sp. SPB1-3]
MRKISIANERPNPFYVRLKPVAGDNWYIRDLDDATDKSNRKVSFPDSVAGQDLLIDELSFFNKQAWYKFTIDDISGWILKRSVKANYRRLAIKPIQQESQSDIDNQATALMMLLTSGSRDSIGYDVVLDAVKKWNDTSTDLIDLKSIIIDHTHSIKDLRKVNMRQLQTQLMRRKPILLRVAGMNNLKNSFILIVGFNKHTIYYNDPWTGRLEIISTGHLKKHLYENTVDAISY